jgi:transketolase
MDNTTLTSQEIVSLEILATRLRIDVLKMLLERGNGHAAGPLGLADIFAYLYKMHLKHPQDRSKLEINRETQGDADYFLVSNGHICPIWYASLMETGYLERSELESFRRLGSRLQGHPLRGITPGVFNTSGPLGHGQSQAIGAALGLKLDGLANQVYCVVSDGEQQEGAAWEAAMTAAKYQLGNLTFIMDRNGIQIDGNVEQIMPLPEIEQAYRAFGWEVISIDGHDFQEIKAALDKSRDASRARPLLMIANTTSGKGAAEMEGKYEFHDWRGDNELANRAKHELQNKLAELEGKKNV